MLTAEQEDVLKAQLDNSVDEIDKEIETKQLQGEEREGLNIRRNIHIIYF